MLPPPDTIQPLNLTPTDESDAVLANGAGVSLPGWLGAVLWPGRPRSILVLPADGAPLLGMNLLRGSRVTLDVQVGGDVVIEELSR